MIQKFTIGRNPNNTIVINHPAVSGYHADLIAVDNANGFTQYTFVDHSTNGTFINGQFLRNASCFVVYNDSITLAGVVQFDWSALGFSRMNAQAASPLPQSPIYNYNVPRERITFAGALKSFFNNYVNFEGRASRREYWCVFLWIIGIC